MFSGFQSIWTNQNVKSIDNLIIIIIHYYVYEFIGIIYCTVSLHINDENHTSMHRNSYPNSHRTPILNVLNLIYDEMNDGLNGWHVLATYYFCELYQKSQRRLSAQFVRNWSLVWPDYARGACPSRRKRWTNCWFIFLPLDSERLEQSSDKMTMLRGIFANYDLAWKATNYFRICLK